MARYGKAFRHNIVHGPTTTPLFTSPQPASGLFLHSLSSTYITPSTVQSEGVCIVRNSPDRHIYHAQLDYKSIQRSHIRIIPGSTWMLQARFKERKQPLDIDSKIHRFFGKPFKLPGPPCVVRANARFETETKDLHSLAIRS